MNIDIITETAKATLAGTLSFPEAVGQFLAAGVEYYHVDYARLEKTFYSGSGESTITLIGYENLPPVAPEFNSAALRAAIFDSQHNAQPYRAFTVRAMASGVQSYYAFLRGQRVTYTARSGDQHIEWFPGAEPVPY